MNTQALIYLAALDVMLDGYRGRDEQTAEQARTLMRDLAADWRTTNPSNRRKVNNDWLPHPEDVRAGS